jgi:hypothetical protein
MSSADISSQASATQRTVALNIKFKGLTQREHKKMSTEVGLFYGSNFDLGDFAGDQFKKLAKGKVEAVFEKATGWEYVMDNSGRRRLQ